MSEQNHTECLKLLNDSVLDPKNDPDSFNHRIYAKILAKIFNPNSGNKFGISVALFGKWGQGKSSVVEMLKEELENCKVKVVLFNAWQSRGDSVRRQLFLQVLDAINKSEAKKMKRFAGLEVTRELLQTESDKCESIKHARRNIWKSIREDKLLGWSFVGILTLLIIPIYDITNYFVSGAHINWAGTISQAVVYPILFFIFKYVRETVVSKYTGLLGISEPISESQRLKYPEQFKDLFIKHTALFSHEHNLELLVVIDDLDRCEPETVVESLASIRQLSGIQKYVPNEDEKHHGEELIMRCRFLIPCDDKQVVLALEADGYFAGRDGVSYHDYQNEELLRKFFDVIVRMDRFIPEDMVTYAGKMLTSVACLTGKDIAAVQDLVGAVAPRDPRQVKKLANAYLVLKEKLNQVRETKRFREESSLPCLDKTLLFVIAIQETIPDIFDQLVESTIQIQDLRQLDFEHEKQEEKKTAARILRALEPVSEQTFRLITRKGLPEELINVNNGPAIYDAVLSGNVEVFGTELAETDNIDQIVAWLKIYRRSLQSTSQFRYALDCLIRTETKSDEILRVIQDYLQSSRLKEALKDYDGIEQLAYLGVEGKLSDSGYNALRQCISENLDELDTSLFIGSNELEAMLILTSQTNDLEKQPFINKLARQLRTTDPKRATEVLTELKNNLPENYHGLSPTIALTLTTECTWSIYDTNEPEKNKGLHSDLIAAFVGEDEETTSKLFNGLFDKKGPLVTVFNFKAGNSNKGEREAIRTLTKIAVNLSKPNVVTLYEKIKPWMDNQPDPTDYHSVCDVLQKVWTLLSEKEIDDLAIRLANHAATLISSHEWFYVFVDSGIRDTEERELNYVRFCNKILRHLNESYINGPSINDQAKSLLKGMLENKWPVEEEADRIFGVSIKSHINASPTWQVWRNVFWPLVENHHSLTEQAIREKIKQKQLLDQMIPFAVETLCCKQVSLTLATTLKEYFLAEPTTLNTYFVSMFKDSTISGTEQIIKLVIDDLSAKKFELSIAQVDLLINNCSCMTPDTKAHFENYLRIQYLQKDDINNISKGISLLQKLAPLGADTLNLIRKIAAERDKQLSAETKTIIKNVLGEDGAEATTSARS